MKFLSFLVSRIGKALVVVLGVVIINFFLIRLAPGDPAAVLAGRPARATPPTSSSCARPLAWTSRC